MIKANEAYHNIVLHQTRKPISSISTVSEMIKYASMLGYETIDISIELKHEQKIRNKLKEAGYLVDVLYVRTLPDEVFLTIKWATAKFIGETVREMKGE